MLLASFLALYVAGDPVTEENPIMSNSFYTATGNPLTRSLSNSAAIRAEFAAVQAAFDRFPDPLVGLKGFTEAVLTSPDINGGTIDDATLSGGTCIPDKVGVTSDSTAAASLTAAFGTAGVFGAYRSSKTNNPFSLGVAITAITDDYLLFDVYGNVIFGDGTDAQSTGATDGFLMIPTCAGIPTGTPAHLYNSSVPLIYDSTNNKLYVYDGGWKATAALT